MSHRAVEERIAELVENFDQHFGVAAANPKWRPNADTATARAVKASTGLRRPSRLLDDRAFLNDTYDALRKWRAFRGGPSVSFDALASALVHARPHLDRWAAKSIEKLNTAREALRLRELFASIDGVKPTRTKWVATSKALYHLLPDLVVPMDATTARFLGWSGMRRGLELSDLTTAYDAFSRVARGAPERGHSLESLADLGAGTVRLGLARVIDFGIQGLMTGRAAANFRTRRNAGPRPAS